MFCVSPPGIQISLVICVWGYRYHGDTHITVTPALSITSLVSFFGNEQKSLTRGENHYKSNHVESFTYSDGIIRGEVHASMKKKVYKVTVSTG